MIRFLPEIHDLPTLFLCLFIVAIAVAMIAEYFLGDRK